MYQPYWDSTHSQVEIHVCHVDLLAVAKIGTFDVFISCDDEILDALKSLCQNIPSVEVCSQLESAQIENSH